MMHLNPNLTRDASDTNYTAWILYYLSLSLVASTVSPASISVNRNLLLNFLSLKRVRILRAAYCSCLWCSLCRWVSLVPRDSSFSGWEVTACWISARSVAPVLNSSYSFSFTSLTAITSLL